MAVNIDADALHRVLAGAAALVQQGLAAAEREKAKDQAIADLTAQLGQAQTDLAAQAQANEAANQALVDTATAMDGLLKGPETPTVETPPPDQAPGVVDGSGDAPVVTDPGPTADTPPDAAPPV